VHSAGAFFIAREDEMVIRKGTFTVRYMDRDHEEHFTTGTALENEKAAHIAAQRYVGNSAGARLFAGEKTTVYGPGDGTTSVMVQEDIDFSE
jgi:hypothetical protein